MVSSITGDALMTSRLAMEGEVDDVYSSESNKPVNFASRIDGCYKSGAYLMEHT
jgi:hypothetical protein